MEARTLLAAIVSNAADSGEGTLRAAVAWANTNPGADTIEFAAGLAGRTIAITSGELRITDNLTIVGLGADQLTISGSNKSRIFVVERADQSAATIAIKISGLALVNGRSENGGAVTNNEDLTVTNCTITGNWGANAGGGILNLGTLAVTGSTIANNFAWDGSGGGIANAGTLTVTNSTLAGNSAAAGGGILNAEAGTLTVINSTLAGNSAGFGGGILNAGTLTAANSLLGGNTASAGPDVMNVGTIAAAKYNVIQNGACSGITAGLNGNQVGVAVLLDPAGLGDHGGPTRTIALLPGSPALNAGNNALAVDANGNLLEFDQRGSDFSRFSGATVDVGAWEAQNHLVANDDAATTKEDTAVGIEVLDNDRDTEGHALMVVLPGGEPGPLHGTVILSQDGSLAYTPEPDYFGLDTFTYQACDSDGLCDTAIVTINVLSVNDPPTFQPGIGQVVDEDAGRQTVANWAANISLGPTNESGQSVSFVVTNDNRGLFSEQPSVAPDGSFTYTPAPNAYGGATVTVVLRDGGGVENGGLDTSELRTFRLIVNPVIDGVIDVKPGNGNEIDPINLGANGNLPMVIFSGGIDNFDATRVDISSIRLNGKHIDPRQVAFEDIDGDGDVDLVLHFAMSEIRDRGVFNPQIVDSQILTLTADIEGGEAIGPDLIAGDWIRLVPAPGKPKGGK